MIFPSLPSFVRSFVCSSVVSEFIGQSSAFFLVQSVLPSYVRRYDMHACMRLGKGLASVLLSTFFNSDIIRAECSFTCVYVFCSEREEKASS